jgi:peptide/nickel transport system permease protein
MIGPALAPRKTSAPHRRALTLGLAFLAFVVFVSLAAPWIAPADPTFESAAGLSPLGEPLDAGAPGYLLGTDPTGRDLLSRLISGGQTTLLTAFAAVAIATLIGVSVGLLAASSRRFAGEILMRFTDLGMAIPGLLLAAAIASILGRGVPSLIIGLAAVFWAPIARVTYGQAVVLRGREYVEAARVQGAGSLAILVRHVLPHLAPVVGAYAALSIGWAVLFESSLGFLGAGVPEPGSSLGSMLGCCLVYYRSHPGLIIFPALYLGLLVAAANLVGESMRPPAEGNR